MSEKEKREIEKDRDVLTAFRSDALMTFLCTIKRVFFKNIIHIADSFK